MWANIPGKRLLNPLWRFPVWTTDAPPDQQGLNRDDDKEERFGFAFVFA
jgi:hypothetical protein